MAHPRRVATAPELPNIPVQHIASVASVDGVRCILEIGKTKQPALIATHLLELRPGQRVLALDDGTENWLVIAAWPMDTMEPPYRFDMQTGTLHIQASRLQLSALGSIELCCGDATVKLSLDGKVRISGAEILSAAIGPNRIEGASIDLN
jgi:hypothetical protein